MKNVILEFVSAKGVRHCSRQSSCHKTMVRYFALFILGSMIYAHVWNFCLMFASCIYCRGTSTSSKLAPFRECYGRLHELRSLIPSAVILSLTATATRETKRAILDVLGMKDPQRSPMFLTL